MATFSSTFLKYFYTAFYWPFGTTTTHLYATLNIHNHESYVMMSKALISLTHTLIIIGYCDHRDVYGFSCSLVLVTKG